MAIYTIGQMARKLGVSTSTLRYYDSEGLLPFVGRTSGGARVFRDEDMPMINIIGCLKAGGMPIKDIKRYVDLCDEGDATIGRRLDMIRNQRDAVVAKMRELQDNLDALDYKLWYYQTADRLGSCEQVDALPDDELSPEMRELRHRLSH
ncbi:MerR family transcriptional regulator [Bifidobacterium boum]|uniref:MerR family transcriptional regulator n=1 Tax=Bifidobacterium boum TaxID=78343 RepID=UPI003F919056